MCNSSIRVTPILLVRDAIKYPSLPPPTPSPHLAVSPFRPTPSPTLTAET